jgi:hypothetical protein
VKPLVLLPVLLTQQHHPKKKSNSLPLETKSPVAADASPSAEEDAREVASLSVRQVAKVVALVVKYHPSYQ